MIKLDLFGNVIRYKSGTDTQGQKANSTGRDAEGQVEHLFKSRGYVVKRQVKLDRLSIYRTSLHADLFVSGLELYPNGLFIEVKWQTVSGSVDEKYPYLVENIKARKYPQPVLIVLDGGGYKPGAAEWLRAQVDGRLLVYVFSMVELMTWVYNNC